jgi:hypothetical protein
MTLCCGDDERRSMRHESPPQPSLVNPSRSLAIPPAASYLHTCSFIFDSQKRAQISWSHAPSFCLLNPLSYMRLHEHGVSYTKTQAEKKGWTIIF